MKTAATVLQEYAVKLGQTPEYECIAQSGPQHQATFEYRCTLSNESATSIARSKKEAKQEVARALLTKLARAGHSVPPPWGLAQVPVDNPDEPAVPAVPDAKSYVALLKEYCEEYKLPAPQYTLVADAGPSHLRIFTIRVFVGAHFRDATALNKKTARQIAAEDIYKYLRGCLRSTQDFVEADAMTRVVDKKMGRFKEERKDLPLRPQLDQKVSEYQCGLEIQFNELKRAEALEAIQSTKAAGQTEQVQLECAAGALGIELEWGEMPSDSSTPLVTLHLPTTCPSLATMGRNCNDAARNMIHYLLLCLQNPPREYTSLEYNAVEESKRQKMSPI